MLPGVHQTITDLMDHHTHKTTAKTGPDALNECQNAQSGCIWH